MLLFFPPPVIPISVCEASPGPLTTQPIIDSVIGVLICANFSSSFFTVSITLKPCLAHDGQEIILTPLDLKFKDFKISFEEVGKVAQIETTLSTTCEMKKP